MGITRRWLLSLVIVCVLTGTLGAQQPFPDLAGKFDVGLQKFRAVDEARRRRIDNYLWYPVDPEDANGAPLVYRYSSATFESPFLGGFAEAPASAAGPFPLIALSHGHLSPWPEQFAMLAESLAETRGTYRR